MKRLLILGAVCATAVLTPTAILAALPGTASAHGERWHGCAPPPGSIVQQLQATGNVTCRTADAVVTWMSSHPLDRAHPRIHGHTWSFQSEGYTSQHSWWVARSGHHRTIAITSRPAG